MKAKPPVTMGDIARRADVSVMTVSLALRNDPRLRPDTRQRIQAIARELGYRPNPVLAIHMAGVRARAPQRKVETLAFITAFPTADGWRKKSHVFREYFDGATSRADQLGYRLEEVWAKEPGMTGARLSKILLVRGIRGLLIGPLPVSYGHLSLDWSRFAAATVGYSARGPALSRAVADYYNNVFVAVRVLRRHGYRRVGLVFEDDADERCNRLYSAAALSFQKYIRLAERVPALLFDSWSDKQFEAWFQKFRPDALLVAGGAVYRRRLERCGRRVPRDVAVVNLGYTSLMSVAGIDQNGRAIGAAAVDLVVGQLSRNELGLPEFPKLVMIPGTWVDGPTVRHVGRR